MTDSLYAGRLAALRAAMRREGADALIIPTADYHGSEYVAEHFQTREHYCGFTGSAGTLLVLAGKTTSDAAGTGSPEHGGCGGSAEGKCGAAGASSAGCAAPEDAALLWTDGRYYIQAERELAGSGVFLMRSGEAGVPTLNAYLKEHLPAGGTLAFDGRCMTAQEGRRLQEQLRAKKGTVRADLDLAGEVWQDRPALPSHTVWILDAQKYAGETASSKLSRLRERMAKRGATAFVSGKLDEIMWLYNLRGNDVECNPVALSYTVVTAGAALLYLQESEVTDGVRAYLEEIGVELQPYEDFFGDLETMRFDAAAGDAVLLRAAESNTAAAGDSPICGTVFHAESAGAADAAEQNKTETEDSGRNCADVCPLPDPEAVRIWYDPSAASYAVYDTLRKNLIHILRLEDEPKELYVNAVVEEHLIGDLSPLTAMKAVRNETEIANTKSCYLEDSAVLTKFIYWVKKTVTQEAAGGGVLTEAAAAEKLDGMRAQISDFVELSFGTISAYGPNAAMMHYEPGEDGGAILRPEGMLLVDSGAHYLRGTTDVTRTIALGPVTEEMRRDYTLTAVSQLRMMDTVFLEGCSGMALDVMAREPMWRNGMDYKCGTGHGIGYLLNVHEGPHNLRWRARTAADQTPFAPGMIVSDEPGVYKSGRVVDSTLPVADPLKGAVSPDMEQGRDRIREDSAKSAARGTGRYVPEGAFGIRIETILLTKEWGTTPDGRFLCFEPLTFVPLDPALIDPEVLPPDARASLNRYHAQVLEKLTPYMDEEELAWLRRQCGEI